MASLEVVVPSDARKTKLSEPRKPGAACSPRCRQAGRRFLSRPLPRRRGDLVGEGIGIRVAAGERHRRGGAGERTCRQVRAHRPRLSRQRQDRIAVACRRIHVAVSRAHDHARAEQRVPVRGAAAAGLVHACSRPRQLRQRARDRITRMPTLSSRRTRWHRRWRRPTDGGDAERQVEGHGGVQPPPPPRRCTPPCPPAG